MGQSFDEQYKNFWDSRYSSEEYVYGKQPNEFFKEQLLKLTPGSILMPADGEARNGVFAAEQGWKVISMDLSIEAKGKALSWQKKDRWYWIILLATWSTWILKRLLLMP